MILLQLFFYPTEILVPYNFTNCFNFSLTLQCLFSNFDVVFQKKINVYISDKFTDLVTHKKIGGPMQMVG